MFVMLGETGAPEGILTQAWDEPDEAPHLSHHAHVTHVLCAQHWLC